MHDALPFIEENVRQCKWYPEYKNKYEGTGNNKTKRGKDTCNFKCKKWEYSTWPFKLQETYMTLIGSFQDLN